MARKRANKQNGSMIRYTGPLTSNNQPPGMVVRLSVVPTTVTSDASGVVASAITTVSATTAQDFSSYSSCFAEYRVLGIRVEYQPFTPFGASNYSTGNVISVHSTALSTPGSAAAVAAAPMRKLVNFGKPWNMEWRMDGTLEAQFIQTSGTANNGGIAWYATNGAASTAYGSYSIVYLLEFRGQV